MATFKFEYEQFLAKFKDQGYTYSSREWFGGLTYEEIRNYAVHGNEKLVPEAEKLISKLDAEIELERAEWLPSVAGPYGIVAEYLADSPTPMRMRSRVPSDNTPIGIWVDLTSSAGVGHEIIMRRGIVVLALVMKLQQVRAVDLHCCCMFPDDTNGGTFVDLVMPTRPMQLGVVTHVLTCVGFPRHTVYGACQKLNHSLLGRVIREDEEFRQCGNIPANDVTIVGSHLNDVQELANSLAWVQGMVNKYVHREE